MSSGNRDLHYNREQSEFRYLRTVVVNTLRRKRDHSQGGLFSILSTIPALLPNFKPAHAPFPPTPFFRKIEQCENFHFYENLSIYSRRVMHLFTGAGEPMFGRVNGSSERSDIMREKIWTLCYILMIYHQALMV